MDVKDEKKKKPNEISLTGLLATLPTLQTTLQNTPNITILAPSNAAFNSFLASPGNSATAGDPTQATALLQYHVLNGLFPASAFRSDKQFLPSLLTDQRWSNVSGGQVVEGVLEKGKVVLFGGLKEGSTVQTAVCQ